MHEMSLSRSLLEIIEDQARERHFAKVRSVKVELGCLGHVDSHALRFCFDVVTRSTVAEGSELIIVDRPGKVACLECGAVSDALDRTAGCPECDSQRVMIDGGEELKLTELEVD
jgi:hydrogenase nickel incorporation protein HypA/HybF